MSERGERNTTRLPDDLELLDEVSAPVVSDYPYGNAAAAQRDRPIDAST
jgi:hypothetical protein